MGKDWDGADGFRRSLNPADAVLTVVGLAVARLSKPIAPSVTSVGLPV
jgi:hypothetical protein